MKENHVSNNKQRDSSIELLRIITMLVIVAHHYVVNSGLMDLITQNSLEGKSIFLLLFGWGGKYGINCFLLITGYFMCKSNITLNKFLKLLLEVEFYKIVIYVIFLVTGISSFSAEELIKTILPVYSIGTGFTNSYLVFFLFIPFLNILIKAMDEKTHTILLILCVTVFSIIPTFCKADVKIGYVAWFMIIYMIGAYIRLYSKTWIDNKNWLVINIILIVLALLSVVGSTWISSLLEKHLYYYFVNDSNKLLALLPAVSTFIYFKNLKIGYSRIINKIATSAFGVLMIHANSATMRQWLWKDTLNNVGMYSSGYMVLHALLSVVGVYVVCTIIDMVRIRLIEKPIMMKIDKMLEKDKEYEKRM